MTNWSERAFDAVTEITKQVLTLATGIVALTVTFFNDFAEHAGHAARLVLAVSWGLFAVSVAAGLMTLMASAAHQQRAATNRSSPSINAGNLRLIGILQLGSFGAALLATAVAGWIAL